MKKFFKISGIILLSLIITISISAYLIHEPIPVGKTGTEADSLTSKVQKAINQEAWDSTVAISWSFMNKHHYLWDKKKNIVRVIWGDNRVIYNTKTGKGIAYDDDIQTSEEKAQELINTANDYFNNDSFWLIAPFKLKDAGTTRSVVQINGEKGLMITYASGGSTPGDSYVWLLNEDFTPKAWKLWVSIFPIGGIEFGWNDWKTYSTGAKVASLHQGLFDLKIENIKLGMNIQEINNGIDPFEGFSL